MTTQEWIPFANIKIGETLKWKEPLWAAPTKPRGKRNIIGEQQIVAKLKGKHEILELEVISVTKLSSEEANLSVKEGDYIKRKLTSLKKGNCHKLVS